MSFEERRKGSIADRVVLLALTALLVIIVGWGAFIFTRTAWWVSNTDKLAARAVPYGQAGSGAMNILVLGDSLAYGVGSSSPQESFVGQIGKHYQQATIINKAGVGDITRDLAETIDAKIDRRYDLIIIVIGGNDIVHVGVNLEESKQHLSKIYEVASKNADQVVTITSGDFNNVTLIPHFLKSYFSKRSGELRDYSLELAKRYDNVAYADAYELDKRAYATYEASDHIHLNDTGARQLFGIVSQYLKEAQGEE